jgi:two-component system chemotaxis sensor kinase CheA
MQEFYQDAALLQEFLTESEELLQGFDHDLLKLESAPDDEELLNRIFRALHTIKGTASFLGFEPIVQLGHRAEDVLSGLRRHELQLTSEVTNALLAARDQLGVMLADLRAGALKHYSIDSLLAELSRLQTANQSLAVAGTAQPAPSLSGSPHLPATPQLSEAPTVASTSMRVDVRKLDTLINLIGELVLERNRLLQIAKDLDSGSSAEESPLHSSAVRLSYLTEELQAAGLRTRMVAIETIFCKFPRMVRDLARSLHKEVDLIIRGEQTQIDKTLVELVSDPLVHLLRNALDHGMEAPEVRERAGKSRRGRICLEAMQEGRRIVVRVSDDGAGIDTQRVLARALEKGLVSRDRAESLSQREILDFIFVPGFSTSE